MDQTLTSNDFKAFFLNFFTNVSNTAQIDWEGWFRGTGMPPVDNKFDDVLARDVLKLVRSWMDSRGVNSKSADIKDWIAMQTMFFMA